MSNLFVEWLPDVVNHTIVICADDINAEARGNLWTFTLSPEQAAATNISDATRFAEQVNSARREALIARQAGPMVLYWWHDSPAGQLRFSLVSASHGRLPFACEIVAAPSLEAVIEEWFTSPYLHGIPWSELSAPEPLELLPSPSPVLLWAIKIP